jgi:hypothetical protein
MGNYFTSNVDKQSLVAGTGAIPCNDNMQSPDQQDLSSKNLEIMMRNKLPFDLRRIIIFHLFGDDFYQALILINDINNLSLIDWLYSNYDSSFAKRMANGESLAIDVCGVLQNNQMMTVQPIPRFVPRE